MKLPEEFNYAEAYLTLRCGLGCSYCINNVDGVRRSRPELSADEWIAGLNKIDFGDTALTLGGGEPTMHPEFFDIVDGLDAKINLLTNLQFDIPEFLKRVKPSDFKQSDYPAYRSIRVSYHHPKHNPSELIGKVRALQDNGFSVGLFGLTHPDNAGANLMMAELARSAKVLFIPKDFMGDHNGQMYGTYRYPAGLDGVAKQAQCRTSELLLSPEGNIHRCHSDLYHNLNPIGNITGEYSIEYKFRPCDNYGKCNPCDVKQKVNLLFKGRASQVDIE